MSEIIDNLILSSISEMANNPAMVNNTSLIINGAKEVDTKILKCNMPKIDLNWYDAPTQYINDCGILFQMVKLIDFYLGCNKQVIVNCFAGVSRSATIVIAYIMYKNKLSVQDAILFVRSKRNIINPNYGFVCKLYNLQEKLHTLDTIDHTKNIVNKSNIELIVEIEEVLSAEPFIKEICEREFSYIF
jgi:protein-tyrosine phosphatase